MNVLLTGDSKALKASFLSAQKGSVALKAGLAAAAVGAGLAAKALFDVGKEFDEAYDKIRVGTGKTGKELDKLKKDFKNVVSSVPADFEDAAVAVAELNTRLGISGKPLRGLAKQFTELSRITGSDIGEDVKTVTRAFGDWEVATKNQGKTLDQFFRASQESGATVSELADIVVKFGAPFRQFGFDLGEATAMFASFEKAGVNIQTMVPGLKFALKTFLGEDRDPKKALQKTFKGIEDGSIKASDSLKLFGQRAGADMVEAVEQGRFHIAGFTKQIEGGNDTIRRAGRETMDASENFKLLGNKIKVFVEPAATALYEAVGKLSGSLARVNFKNLMRDLGLSGKDMREFGRAIRAVVRVLGPILGDALKGAVQAFKGFLQAVRGIAKIISGVLTGDFGKAWDGVKDLFSGGAKFALGAVRAMTAPLRSIVGGIGRAMGRGFSAAWDKVKDIFEGGVNSVIGFVNKVIDAINIIPGVDIGHVGKLGGDGGKVTRARKDRGAQTSGVGRQRGGFIADGVPGRDSVPALLERDEYVLNKKAVKAAGGPAVLDALNFGMAPRFAVGGAVTGLLSKGAGALIDKLPKPNIPQPLTGLGPWLLAQVADWIKGKVSSIIGGKEIFGKLVGGGSAKVVAVGKWLQSLGYQVGEHPAFGGVAPVHSTNSLHYSGRAIDVNADGRPGGEAKWLDRIFPKLAAMNPAELLWRVKDHFDHLHVGFAKGGQVGRGVEVGAGARAIGSLWRTMQGMVGKRGGHLDINYFSGRGVSPWEAAMVPTKHGSAIDLSAFARDALTGGGHKRNRANALVIHELTHALQSRKLTGATYRKNATLAEGGADAWVKLFGNDALRRAGLGGRTPLTGSYPREMAWVLKNKGRDWVAKSQFTFQKGGRVPWGKLVGSSWDNNELATLAHIAGMANPGLMAQIAMGESSGNAKATNRNTDGSVDRGLWQINSVHGFKGDLFDPLVNARAAAKVLASSGTGAWFASPSGPKGKVDSSLAQRIRAAMSGGPTGGSATAKEDFKFGLQQHRRPVQLPPLKAGRVPKALRGLGPGITSLFTSPGMTREQRFGASELGLQLAEQTKMPLLDAAGNPVLDERGNPVMVNDPSDDRPLLQFQLGASRQRKKAIQKEINRLGRRLKKRLSPKQRRQILAKRNALIDELGTVQGQIGSAREGIKGLNEPPEGGEGEETPAQVALREAIERQTQAAEEQARAIEQQAAEQKALREEMTRNREIAESIQGTSAAVAMRALADVLSGQLGPMAFRRSQTAGAGSIGSF